MNILIHGFNVTDSSKTTGKLKGYLDYSLMFNYGWRLFSVLWHNRKDAKRLKRLLANHHNSNIYAHSNGCAIAVEAVRRGASIKSLICINPALKKNTVFPNNIEQIIVIHTRHDVPTKAASFFDKIPLLQLFIPNAWGAMGASGSKSQDKRVLNINLSHQLRGHSDFFDDDNLEVLMPRIQRVIERGIIQ